MIHCIPDLLTPEQVRVCRETAERAIFVDGAETAGPRSRRVKRNEQVSKNDNSRRPVQQLIVDALFRNREVVRTTIPYRIRPPLISRYRQGNGYGLHADEPLMGDANQSARTDLSCTVFLSDVADYEGGELLVQVGSQPERLKLPAGHAAIYPSSFLHQVTDVTAGERLVAVTWIQSYVRDIEQRRILADLVLVRGRLEQLAPSAAETDLSYRIRANLMRMWAEN
jgi:PKHD-type hydroxylase